VSKSMTFKDIISISIIKGIGNIGGCQNFIILIHLDGEVHI